MASFHCSLASNLGVFYVKLGSTASNLDILVNYITSNQSHGSENVGSLNSTFELLVRILTYFFTNSPRNFLAVNWVAFKFTKPSWNWCPLNSLNFCQFCRFCPHEDFVDSPSFDQLKVDCFLTFELTNSSMLALCSRKDFVKRNILCGSSSLL